MLKRYSGTTHAISRNSGGRKRASANRQRWPGPRPESRREFVPLRDLADCLLDAYDFVAERAYEKFIERGNLLGDDLADWLSAERELLPKLPADIQDAERFVYALVSFPGPNSRRVSVGIESSWLIVLAHSQNEQDTAALQDVAPVACVMQLPAEVDRTTSTVIRCDKLLGIRMPKIATRRIKESTGARN